MTPAITLLVLSGIAGLVAWIWLVVIAFQREEKAWGTMMIVGIFLPFGSIITLVYLVTRWSHARQPGMLYLSSLGAAILGGILFATSLKSAIEASPEFTDMKAQAEAAAAARGERSLDASGWTPPPVQPPPPPRHTAPQARASDAASGPCSSDSGGEPPRPAATPTQPTATRCPRRPRATQGARTRAGRGQPDAYPPSSAHER